MNGCQSVRGNFNHVCILDGQLYLYQLPVLDLLSFIIIADTCVKVSAPLVIGENFLFKVHMQGRQVSKQLFELETADSVGAVLGIMSKISSSRVSCGNPDERFHPIMPG